MDVGNDLLRRHHAFSLHEEFGKAMTAIMSTLEADVPLVPRPRASDARRPGARIPSAGRPESEWTARMRQAIGGDEAAYRGLLGDIGGLAREVARGLLARFNFGDSIVDDIVQETLLAVHLGRKSWDSARPVRPWAATIARNKTIDAVRKSHARFCAPINVDLDAFAAPATAEPGSRLDVNRLLARLPQRQREIVVSIALRQESIADVASRHAMSKVAVRVAFHRALRAMAKATRSNGDADRLARTH
jgi:RNA polymerase sigma-70 factor (ECF subfamily)